MANYFTILFHGFSKTYSFSVPAHINVKLEEASTPEEIESIISDHEAELANLLYPCDDFLVCDTAAELMADVLHSKGIEHQIICGISDAGDSHSYVRVGGKNYDPTHQGFGDGATMTDGLPMPSPMILTMGGDLNA